MGLLVECPACKSRNGVKKSLSKCGRNFKKDAHKTYWIEYYFNGQRRRERIGPSKDAAEQRLRKVLNARTEKRHIDKNPAATMDLWQLTKWYLELPNVKAKKSFNRDQDFITHLERIIGKDTKIEHITAGRLEEYQQRRLFEDSPRRKGQKIKPATVNKEVSCLKTVFNRAIRHGILKENPVDKVKKLTENNVRMRILSINEFNKLYECCAPHMKPVVLTAYYTGMRRSEIIFLSWDNIDLKNGFIRLSADMTKTNTARSIPLHPKVLSMLNQLPRSIKTARVFLKDGKPFTEIKTGFTSACRRAGLKDFTFHDLRHCALNNMRLAGNDYFRIMAASGHKTTAVFKRYNLVTEDELSQMKWLDEGTMDTYMDTYNEKGFQPIG